MATEEDVLQGHLSEAEPLRNTISAHMITNENTCSRSMAPFGPGASGGPVGSSLSGIDSMPMVPMEPMLLMSSQVTHVRSIIPPGFGSERSTGGARCSGSPVRVTMSTDVRAAPSQDDADENLESKAMLRKVLSGLRGLAEQQARIEDILVAQSRHAGRGRPVRGSSSLGSQFGSGIGSSSPVRNPSDGLGVRKLSAAALSTDDPLGAPRLTKSQPGSMSLTYDEDAEGDFFLRDVSAERWPADVCARHPPPMELAQDDEKLVAAISKMGFAGRGLSFARQNSGEQHQRCLKLPVFHPNSSKILLFDFLGCAVLLHDVCVTPYVLAWRTDVEGPLLLTAYLSFLFWILDTMMGFCMAFYRDGELQQTQPEVACQYLRRQFPIDVCLIFADILNLFVDTLVQAGSSLTTDREMRVFRVFKLTRLLKLARAARVARLIDKMWVSETDAPTSSSAFVAALVAKILIVTIISNHILACLWFWQGAHGPSDTERTWLEEGGLSASSRAYQYFTSLHWSVAQMTLGASDSTPSNSYERFLNIAFLLNGLVFGSTTVSYVSAAIVDYIMMKRDTTNQLLECRRFLRQYGCHQKLSAQVVKQVSKRLSEEVPLKEVDVQALTLLAPTLRASVHHATRIPHLERHALFNIWSEVENRCLETLSETAVSHRFMSREDDLFQAGSFCDQAWVLVRGRLKYTQQPGQGHAVKEETTIVHSNTWIAEAALWSYWSHVGSIEANEKSCHLLTISADAMLQMLPEFPTIQCLTRQYAKNFHSCLTSAGPPHSKWPTDLHIPFTEDTAMLLSQHVGMGLLKRALAHGRLELSSEDEEYVVKELMAGKCTIQYAEDGFHLERVVYLANVMLGWFDTSAEVPEGTPKNCPETPPPNMKSMASGSRSTQGFAGPSVLYQLGAVDAKGKAKLALHMPGTKRLTGESPQLALQRILDADLRPFANSITVEDSIRKVSVKDSTQSVKMRTKTVKTIYRSSLSNLPSSIQSWKVPFPNLPGLEQLHNDGHTLLALPQGDKAYGLYAFLLPRQYDILDRKENGAVMKEWISSLSLSDAPFWSVNV